MPLDHLCLRNRRDEAPTSSRHETRGSVSATVSGTRREFIGALIAGTLGLNLPAVVDAATEGRPFIQTVLGPIPAGSFGSALTHEHLLVDFIGAAQTGRHRWDVSAVVKRMLPYLTQLKERGVTGLVECTTAYFGRDPRVLKQLAEATGLHIVTNTGYYGNPNDKYLPKHAYDETADQLAARWVREWEQGIEDTGIKPGFMKIGIHEAKGDPLKLSDIHEKLVRAAAGVSKRTGLTTVCHTGFRFVTRAWEGGGPAGLAAARLFIAEGGAPGRFIMAHSDGHGLEINQQAAELGVWVAYDAISRRSLEQHLELVTAMIKKHAGRVLLSHDNGWFNVGQANGGEVRDFNYLHDTFLPALRKAGVSQEIIHGLTVKNPAAAFGVISPSSP
ncbi:MAG: hypothetical protein L0Z50_14535 [Verrucomicrobiales bacterium]|nr:hypothetical protein [Verrucomicrobiales bacterium]